MVSNAGVAAALGEIADLLDLLGERFKPEAYRRAARSVEALPESLEAIAGRDELRSIPGVGEAIAEKVGELLRTGSLGYLERLRAEVPAGVLELMRLPGVGPKTARRFWTELSVDGPAALAQAIAAGRLTGVKGFADKKISQLRAATAGTIPPSASRTPIEQALPLARSIVRALRAVPSVHEVAYAGSLRRARETVGDLDILATADRPESVFDAFSRLPEVREVRLRGSTKETVVLRQGLQVDLRVVEPAAFGAALQYFTGSKDHNVRLRSLARERGLKVNEYGVYRGDERIAGRTEAEVYAALGLAWIPPELREDHGEIDAAAAGGVPQLVERTDVTAELHAHLSASADPGELDRLVADARRRAVATVAVVVATLGGTRPRWTAPPQVLARFRERGTEGVRLLPAVEVAGGLAGVADGDLLDGGAALAIFVPGGGGLPTPDAWSTVPLRLVAHRGGSGEAAAPALELARALGAAVEVGPGPERFDSTVGRLARDAGVPLVVPTGVGLPDDDPTSDVALGFARRAGATRAELLNARTVRWADEARTPGRAPTGRSTSRGRRRR